MQKRYLFVIYKIFFALLAGSAVLTEIVVLSANGNFIPSNFFSFFTIESNLFAIATLLLSSAALIKKHPHKYLDLFRGASTLSMAITGIIFSLLLSGIKGAQFTAVPWDNLVLHYIMPTIMIIDWLIDKPKKHITFRQALIWLVIPIAYVIYSLIRGFFINWYPYPFLNPAEQGYLSVGIVSIALSLGAIGLIWLLTRVNKN